MLFLIMLFAMFTDQFGKGLLACLFVLGVCLMVDVLAFFIWASFLASCFSDLLSIF